MLNINGLKDNTYPVWFGCVQLLIYGSNNNNNNNIIVVISSSDNNNEVMKGLTLNNCMGPHVCVLRLS